MAGDATLIVKLILLILRFLLCIPGGHDICFLVVAPSGVLQNGATSTTSRDYFSTKDPRR